MAIIVLVVVVVVAMLLFLYVDGDAAGIGVGVDGVKKAVMPSALADLPNSRIHPCT